MGATHSPLMFFMYAIYEVIQSNRDKATDWTAPKFLTTHVTWMLTFYPKKRVQHIAPSCVDCMTHINWFVKTRKKPQSGHNKIIKLSLWRSGHGKNFKRPMWPWPLKFCSENGPWHMAPSCVVYMPYRTWFGQIVRKPQSGHENF